MHELSVCNSLLSKVEEIALQNNVDRVVRVNLQIGSLSGIEPRLLEQAFPIASKGTLAETAELHIEHIPVRVRCPECASETDCTPNNMICSTCGNEQTQLLSGDEMILESIE